jgi:hypothetical protein
LLNRFAENTVRSVNITVCLAVESMVHSVAIGVDALGFSQHDCPTVHVAVGMTYECLEITFEMHLTIANTIMHDQNSFQQIASTIRLINVVFPPFFPFIHLLA